MQAAEHRPCLDFIIPPPEQWTGGGLHKICKMYYQKCFSNNNDVKFVLIQIRSMLIGTGLPSWATPLFNKPIKALLPHVNSKPIHYHTDDENYAALKLQQDKYSNNNDTRRDSISFPIGSTVAIKGMIMACWYMGCLLCATTQTTMGDHTNCR